MNWNNCIRGFLINDGRLKQIVRNALEGGSKAPSDQNIICFQTKKKAENQENQGFQPFNKNAEDGT